MANLATLEELRVRLEFEIDPGDHLEKLAEASLEDASTLVREYGVRSWTADTAPPIAVSTVFRSRPRLFHGRRMSSRAAASSFANLASARPKAFSASSSVT